MTMMPNAAQAQLERTTMQMQSLVRELRWAFKNNSTCGDFDIPVGYPLMVIELESEDGTAQSVVIVAQDETPESLAALHGHRIISAGYLYRTHIREVVRDGLAASAGVKRRPSITLSRRERKAAKIEAEKRKAAKAVA